MSRCGRKYYRSPKALDYLICNAGKGFLRPIEQANYEEMENIFSVNFFGVIRCLKTALPFFREQKRGHVIAISSVGGLVGQPLNEVYCASKFALEEIMQLLNLR